MSKEENLRHVGLNGDPCGVQCIPFKCATISTYITNGNASENSKIRNDYDKSNPVLSRC